MSLIHIRALGVTLSATLFSNLNLAVAPGDRIGLVAANGRGKTTLLKCITGQFEPTTGEIFRARGLTVDARPLADAPPRNSVSDRRISRRCCCSHPAVNPSSGERGRVLTRVGGAECARRGADLA